MKEEIDYGKLGWVGAFIYTGTLVGIAILSAIKPFGCKDTIEAKVTPETIVREAHLKSSLRKIEHSDGPIDYISGRVLARRLGYKDKFPADTRFEVTTENKRKYLKAYIPSIDDKGDAYSSTIEIPEPRNLALRL